MAQYRSFIAKTLDEAKNQMLREMGREAYIIKINKIVKKSFMGLRNEEWVEVKAGKLDEESVSFHQSEIGRSADFGGVTLKKKATELVLENKQPIDAAAIFNKKKEDKIEELTKIIASKNRELIRDASQKAQRNTLALEEELDRRTAKLQEENYRKIEGEIDDRQKKLREFLLDKEFSVEFIEYLLAFHEIHFDDSEEAKEGLAEVIASCFKYSSKPKLYTSGANVIILIGPTGVGKSTTIAKIGAEMSLVQGKKTAMCSFDVRRIMAAAQLEKYSEMMDVPFRVISDRSSVKKAIGDFINYSYILFDTSGITNKDKDYFNEMKDFFEYISLPKEINLCISAVYRRREMEREMEYFSELKYDRIIITKVDESRTLGPALSAIHRQSVAISYLTDGQDVPSNIKLGSAAVIKERLLMEWKHG